jgi:hypothetical protein
MQLSNLVPNFFSGLPLTAIGIIAIVVLIAWLFGGVGSTVGRLTLGLPFLAALVGCWLLILLQPVTSAREDFVFWTAAILSIVSFFVPILWRRSVGR